MVNVSKHDGEGDNLLKKEDRERQRTRTAIIPPVSLRDPAELAKQAEIAKEKARDAETVVLERIEAETTDDVGSIVDLSAGIDEKEKTINETPKERLNRIFNKWKVIRGRDLEKNNEVMGYDRIGKYQIKKTLGKGGMGIVFLAFDTTLKREVALKVIWPRNSEEREKAVREATIQANHSHPNVLPIKNVARFMDKRAPMQVGLCLEVDVAKESLYDQRENIKMMNHDEKLSFFKKPVRQIIQGLSQMHRNGILHRDLKIENILVHEDGYPMLADFGLSVPMGEQGNERNIYGTPAFMSLEQATGKNLSPSSDYFSLGIVLYNLMTGDLLPEYEVESMLENVSFLSQYQSDDEFRKAQQKRFQENMEKHQVPKPLAWFILRLLEPRKKKRLSIETINKRLEQCIYMVDHDIDMADTESEKENWRTKIMNWGKRKKEELGQRIRSSKKTIPLPSDEDSTGISEEIQKAHSFPTVTKDNQIVDPQDLEEPSMHSGEGQVYDPNELNYSDLVEQSEVGKITPMSIPIDEEDASSYEEEYAYIEDQFQGVNRYPVEKNEEGIQMMGRYKIGKMLKKNAYTVTYEAVDEGMERMVQITLLIDKSKKNVDRFIAQNKRHAQLAQPERHRQLVDLHDLGLVEGVDPETGDPLLTPFVVTESLERNLQSLGTHFRTASPKKNMERAIPLMKDMAKTLFDLHKENIVHLNLRPEATILSKSGRIKIGGFELIAELEEAKKVSSYEYAQEAEARHSSIEEIFIPDKISFASDWYSYASFWYEVLTGELPSPNLLSKSGDTEQISKKRMELLLKKNVPLSMAELLIRLLEQDPQKRYKDEEILQEDIEEILELSYDEGEELERERRKKMRGQMQNRQNKKRRKVMGYA